MAGPRERRSAERVAVPGRLGSRIRATLEARLLDLSTTGARIEHYNLLRPGFTCSLELPSQFGSMNLPVRVVRSDIVGTQKSASGDQLLRYESGLTFISLTPDQVAAVENIVKRLSPGGGMGNGKLVL